MLSKDSYPGYYELRAESLYSEQKLWEIPGLKITGNRILIPKTIIARRMLLARLANLASFDSIPEDIRGELNNAERAIQQRDEYLRNSIKSAEYRGPTTRVPFPHQVRAIHALSATGYRHLLCDEMGLGKTITALYCYHDAAYSRNGHRLLVLCPKFLVTNWAREVQETLGVIPAPIPHGRNDRDAWIFALAEVQIAIMNYEIAPSLTEAQRNAIKAFVADNFLICDEAHYLKGRSAKRTEFVGDLRPKHILLLTGTAIQNRPIDLYSQLNLLEPQRVWRTWTEFETRFCKVVTLRVPVRSANGATRERAVQKMVGSKNLEELRDIAANYSFRRAKSEVANLPPKITSTVELDLDDQARSLYDSLRDQWRLRFSDLIEKEGGRSISDPLLTQATEALIRMEQISQGCLGGFHGDDPDEITKSNVVINNETGEFILTSHVKFRWIIAHLEDLLDTPGKTCLIWMRFNAPMRWLKHEIESVFKHLNVSVAVLHGGQNQTVRTDMIDGFTTGKYRVMLGQVKMGLGLNFHTTNDVIFIGRDWSPFVNLQAEDRVHRIGQKGTVNVWNLVAKKTIEERIHKQLLAKASDSSTVLPEWKWNPTLAQVSSLI